MIYHDHIISTIAMVELMNYGMIHAERHGYRWIYLVKQSEVPDYLRWMTPLQSFHGGFMIHPGGVKLWITVMINDEIVNFCSKSSKLCDRWKKNEPQPEWMPKKVDAPRKDREKLSEPVRQCYEISEQSFVVLRDHCMVFHCGAPTARYHRCFQNRQLSAIAWA